MIGNFVISIMLSALLMLLPESAYATPAPPVTTGAVSVTQTGFTATWSAASGATGYLLDVATDSNFTSYVSGFMNLDVSSATSYVMSGLNPAVTYYYRVRAYDDVGTSLNSNISALLTLPATPSVPVAAAAASVTQTGFTATWGSAGGATGYRLDVASDAAFTSLISGYSDKDVGNVTSSPVTGLTASTTYYFRVRAYNSGGVSVSSNSTVLVTLPAIPGAPDVATGAASVEQTRFTATWGASSGATGYRLDVSTKVDFSTTVTGYSNLDVANVTSAGVSGLTANTTYYYRVRAYNAGGTSGNSVISVLVTLPLPPVAPVAKPATSITQVGFTANWAVVAGVGGYQLDIATDVGFTAFLTGYNNRDVGNVTTAVVSGLDPGTTYYYRVRAYNNGGSSISSTTVTLVTVPVAPVASAAATVSQTGFTANWGAVGGVTGYYLDVATDAAFSAILASYNNKGVTTGTSLAVSSLTAGTTYYYRVRAYNSGGTSGNSNTISQTTLATPVATAATVVTQTGFTANWNPAANAIGYKLDVATNSTFTTYVAGYNNLDVANVTSSVVTGLTAGTTYYYRVRAYNSTAASTNSNTISQATLGTPPATAATSITASGFTANWGSTGGATGYLLDVATDSGFTSFVAGYNNLDVANVTSAGVSGLTAGTTYYFRVRAYNGTAISTNSTVISVTTVPVAPVAAAATVVTQTALTANWITVSGATGYKLDVSTSNTFSTFVSGYSSKDVSNVTSIAVSSLTAGTTYYYRVRAYNAGGPSANSNTITQTTLATPVATAATLITQTGFTATWNAASSATGYLLDVSAASGFTSFVSGYNGLDVSNVTNYAVSGLSAGTIYYYRVRASNGSAISVNSNTISQTTLATPVAIAATAITQTSFSAKWNAAASATGYLLDVAADSGFTSIVTGYGGKDVGNVLTFTVSGLTAGSTYYYRVRSYTGAGSSTSSNSISVLMLPPTPAAPVATSATNVSQTGLTATWGAVSGATGYYLDVATDPAFGNILTSYNNKSVTTGTSFAVSGLTASTPYYYRVRAYNTGGTSGNSNVINPTTFPTVPVATAATSITQTGFTATWGTVNGATGYQLDVATNLTFTTLVSGFNGLDVANVTSYAVSGLSAGTTYYYRVRAYNIGGSSGSSNTITQITVPPAPVATAATTVTQTGFKATWGAAGGATGYRLDVATDAAFTSFVAGYADLNVLNVTSYSVSGLTTDTVYYYRVRAFNAVGISGDSNIISQATLATPVATAATFVTQTGFTANWNIASGATSYKLDVSTSATFASFVTGYNSKDVGNVVSSLVTGLTAGVTYYYRVRSYSSGVTSANSSVITQATLGTPVATAATSIGQTGFTATWNAASAAAGYQLDVAFDAGFTSLVSGYTSKDVGSVTGLAVSGLSPSTPYYYRVRAYSSGGTSTNSNSITLTTLPAPPVSPAALPATVVSQYGFTANWGSVSGATGYYLDVATDAGFTSFVAGYSNKDMGSVTSSVISGLKAGITYQYRVRAYNTGGTSPSSGVISQTTMPPTPPAVPVAAAATAPAATGFTSNWGTVVGADGYVLDVAGDAAFSSMIAGYANKDVGNVTSFAVTGLASGNSYYYRLRTYNAAGTSAVSNTMTAVTLPIAPLASAANAVTLSGFTASWAVVNGATGYQLDVSTDVGFASYVTGYNGKDVASVTSVAVSSLTAGTTYYYRVRAYDTSGAGSSSNVVTLATLPVATVAAAANTVTQTSFNAVWSVVSGAAGYQLDVSTDAAFTSFVPGYDNRDVANVTSAAVNGLTAGTTYYYRVRSYTAGGAGANSNTVIQATLPAALAAPLALAATSVTSTGFTANWGAVYGASGYRIDISTAADFSSLVVGYNNYDVGNIIATDVTGLAPGTVYYYRVRDYNGGGSGTDSNVISVTTPSSLTVSIAGTGGGAVNSGEGGIACISGSSSNCSALYAGGAQVTLTATPDISSFFKGWSGACSGVGDCLVTLDAIKGVTATFNLITARIFDALAPQEFDSLQAAYDAAKDGDLLQLRSGLLVGDLVAGRPVAVTVRGGYDATYGSTTLDTTQLQGTVTIRDGIVRMEGVTVQ